MTHVDRAAPDATRLALAHLPTPIERYPALDELVGTEVWVKRDDATAGAESGNKIRKLEFLMARAQAERAEVVITCGGLQSNHARATAIVARRLGMQPMLLLRTAQPPTAGDYQGNVLLDHLVGAQVQYITAAQYVERERLMQEFASEYARRGRPAYVIPEGGSNGLGALGYYAAMAEVRAQQEARADELPDRFDAVVHACGSGGTAAGIVLGARHFGVADEVIALAVCDDRAYFEERVAHIVEDAGGYFAVRPNLTPLRVLDEFKGPAYGVPSPEQINFIRTIARATGLVLDPVYSGKALFGLAHMPEKPRRALFIHTGGLPGLLAEHALFM
jgi:D-cysteine desulfhydrase